MISKTKIRDHIISLLLAVSLPCFWNTDISAQNLRHTPLDNMRDIHPRIYFNQNKIEQLRDKIQNTHAEIWENVKEEIDNRMGTPPETLPDQNPMRTYAETIPYFAVSYLMTQDVKYLNAAKEWLMNVVTMEKWGNEVDLGGSHMVYGVCIVYDWLYHELSEDERKTVRDRLITQVEKLRDPTLWWKFKALQNHLWINTTAIGIAGFALYGEVDSAEVWIQECHDKLLWVLNYLSPDGSSPEGVGYAQYGVAYLLKYFDAARDLLGEKYSEIFFEHSFFKNLADFFIYNFCPRNALSLIHI